MIGPTLSTILSGKFCHILHLLRLVHILFFWRYDVVMKWPPQYLVDQLTLFQPGVAESAHPLLLAPPNFFTFRHPCLPIYCCFFYSKGDGLQNLAKCPTVQSHSLYFLFTQSASVWVVRFDMVFSGTLVVNFQFWGSQKRFLILSLIDQFPIRYLGIGRYIQQMNTLKVLPLSTWILFL